MNIFLFFFPYHIIFSKRRWRRRRRTGIISDVIGSTCFLKDRFFFLNFYSWWRIVIIIIINSSYAGTRRLYVLATITSRQFITRDWFFLLVGMRKNKSEEFVFRCRRRLRCFSSVLSASARRLNLIRIGCRRRVNEK